MEKTYKDSRQVYQLQVEGVGGVEIVSCSPTRAIEDIKHWQKRVTEVLAYRDGKWVELKGVL